MSNLTGSHLRRKSQKLIQPDTQTFPRLNRVMLN